MSEVFIPLGGAGGKNRGNSFYISDTAPTAEVFGRIITPLPAGVYKKFVTPDGQVVFPSADGGDAVVSMSKEFLKKQAIKTFGIASITNFSLTMYAHRQVRLTWAKPDRGLFSGIHFVFKYGSMPTNENDGFMFFDSADVHYETARLEERELFVRAFNYVTVKDGRWYDEGAVSARITVTGISGSVTLSTGAGVWTVPDKVDKIRYILVGHGGCGGAPEKSKGSSGAGGGYFKTGYLDVHPGQQFNWVVPDLKGRERAYGQTDLPEHQTKFGPLIASAGMSSYRMASYRTESSGGSGGSGGGGGGLYNAGNSGGGGSNGSDGANGDHAYARGGIGQHTSTLGFNGVLYSGGGGGSHAPGGAGGGGNGWRFDRWSLIVHGGHGTDGLGGGGGGAGGGYDAQSGNGGTGCIYIAWGNLMNDGS